jgi:hypothetical protein
MPRAIGLKRAPSERLQRRQKQLGNRGQLSARSVHFGYVVELSHECRMTASFYVLRPTERISLRPVDGPCRVKEQPR